MQKKTFLQKQKSSVEQTRPLSVLVEGNAVRDMAQYPERVVSDDRVALYRFRDRIARLEDSMNRLSFMISEIHQVLESSASVSRF